MTAALVLPQPAVERLRASRDWRLLGLLFERPRGTWWSEVAELALGCDDADLKRAAEAARTADEGAYLHVLGPGGAVSPREAGYRKTTDPARLLAEVQAYYHAFAFTPRGEDPPDHVAVEVAFLSWLCLKESYALADGRDEPVAVTADAARAFMSTHVASLAHGLEQRGELLGDGWLALASRALVARVGPLQRDLEGDWVPVGLESDDCSLTCGLGGARDEEGGEELPPEFTAGLPPDER